MSVFRLFCFLLGYFVLSVAQDVDGGVLRVLTIHPSILLRLQRISLSLYPFISLRQESSPSGSDLWIKITTTMASSHSEEDPVFSYSQFACIGTGFSAIGLGATLQRWYGITDIRFFDKQTQLGGTWHINQYPGCACDVPSALYSLSFECSPNWTRVLPTYEELWEYLNRVARKYGLVDKMTFDVVVERCVWIEERSRWRMWIRQKKTGQVIVHECQFLYAGVGHFDQPRELGIPGEDRFEGPMFHSARWRHDVDLTGKKVVVFGNGCTGAQIVPAIVDKTASLTQVVRSKHWVYPAIDEKVPFWLMFTLANVPGTMQIQRFLTFIKAEVEYIGFGDGKMAKAWRKKRQRQVEAYMRATAPKKYHDLLIPDFEVGCKRRIFDSGYLKSLHNEHLRLTDEPVEEILPNGLRMKSGEIVEADVIVMANGFKTNQFFLDCEIVGRGGETIHEHWDSFGGAEAYNCESLSGFPNFFLLGGKNNFSLWTRYRNVPVLTRLLQVQTLQPAIPRSSSRPKTPSTTPCESSSRSSRAREAWPK